MERINLIKVHYLPKTLDEGILYVSEEFGVAGHLCPCGCKNKIITPLGNTEWSFEEDNNIPTLNPSIGNWQLPCKSHYWITNGFIEWSYPWTEKQILIGRIEEEKTRKEYYDNLASKMKKKSIFRLFFDWLWKNMILK